MARKKKSRSPDPETDWQFLSAPKRCGAYARSTGEPCQVWAIPFGTRCRRHGGGTKVAHDRADTAARLYQLWSADPPRQKAQRLGRRKESHQAFEMRRARKAGPEHVNGLLRERRAMKEEKRREAEDNTRARRERAEAYRRQRDGHPAVDPDAAPVALGPIAYEGFDLGFDDDAADWPGGSAAIGDWEL